MFDPRLDSGSLRSFDSSFKLPKMSATPPKTNPLPAVRIPANFYIPPVQRAPTKPTSSIKQAETPKNGLINLSKGKVNDASIYKGNFRFRTEQNLKPVLRHAADRSAVANMLWDKRGGGGIGKWEVKAGLRKLEKTGKLNYSQVNAIRKKLGAF